MQKIVLIARVSDVDQRQALPAQKLRLESYARQFNGIPIEYHEFDESAYKDSRQKFAELVDKIQAEEIKQIVVFDKIDRFTRDASQKEVRVVSGLVQNNHIELHFPSDNLIITKDSPATDLFRLGIGMLLAKYYSDAARDNVKRRFEQMRSEGIYPHKAPFGYRNTRRLSGLSNKPVKGIAVNTKTAPIVAKVFELRSQGISYGGIARRLSKLGFFSQNTKKPYQCNVIERMLRNKFYIGVMTCVGKEYPHKYPRLISKELFIKCQLVKQERSISATKASYNSKIHIFGKIVDCGICSRAVSSYAVRNNIYLKCANPACKNPNTAEALLLPAIEKALAGLKMSIRTARKLQNRLQCNQTHKTTEMARIKRETADIDKRAGILYEDRLVGRIDAAQHDKHVGKLENERQNLKKRANFLTSAPEGIQTTVSQMISVCQNTQTMFQNAQNTTKNLMLEILLSNIKLKNKKLSFRLNFPCWGAGEIQLAELKARNRSIWYSRRDSNPRPWDRSLLL